MTVSKNRICGQIVGDRNKVGARTGFLACTRDAGLRVRNNAAFAIHDSSLQQRRECEDDRRCVTTGVCYQHGIGQMIAVQLRQAVDCFLREFGSSNRVGVLEGIHGAVLRLFQPPCSTQVNHADSPRHRFRHQRSGDLVRCGQKKQLDSVLFQYIPRKRAQRISAVSGKNRKHVGEISRPISRR